MGRLLPVVRASRPYIVFRNDGQLRPAPTQEQKSRLEGGCLGLLDPFALFVDDLADQKDAFVAYLSGVKAFVWVV